MQATEITSTDGKNASTAKHLCFTSGSLKPGLGRVAAKVGEGGGTMDAAGVTDPHGLGFHSSPTQ